MPKRFKVVGFIRIEPEGQDPMTHREAKSEKLHNETMQPENIYKIEPLEE